MADWDLPFFSAHGRLRPRPPGRPCLSPVPASVPRRRLCRRSALARRRRGAAFPLRPRENNLRIRSRRAAGALRHQIRRPARGLGGRGLAAAEKLGWPVALKVQSPDIPHKTEAKALALAIADAAALRRAYREVLANAKAHAPAADIRGVLVQKMAPPGVELIAGVARDADFGPIVMCGLGGIHAEIFADVAFAPAPISLAQAETMIDKLKAAKLWPASAAQPRKTAPPSPTCWCGCRAWPGTRGI